MITLPTSNTDSVKSTDRTAAGGQPDNTPVAPGGSPSASGVSSIIAGSNITISPASGTGNVTINANGGAGGIPSGGAPSQELRYGGSSGIAKWAYEGYIYPEDFGAVGDGTTDDSVAINAAAAVVAAFANPGLALFFSGSYAYGTAYATASGGTGSCVLSGIAVESTGSAIISSTGGQAICFETRYNGARNTRINLPSIFGFASSGNGIGIYMNGLNASKVYCPHIVGCDTAIVARAGTGTNEGSFLDCDVDVTWISSCISALAISCNNNAGNDNTGNIMQGNRFYFNYAGSCQHMLNYDGTEKNGGGELCDSNQLIIGATDSATVPSGAIFFYNSQANGTSTLSNWDLIVTMWNGGLDDPPASYVASGPSGAPGKFSSCRFGVSNYQTAAANQTTAYNVQGTGNTYVSSDQSPGINLGAYAWQTSSGSLAAFLNSGPYQGFRYANQTWCSAAISGSISANAVFTVYAYSPFWDAPGSGFYGSMVYRVTPTSFGTANPGLSLESVKPSDTVFGEIQIKWRNVSGATITAGTGIGLEFILTHGLP